jgi:predicted permease
MERNARPPGVRRLFRFFSRTKDDIVSEVRDEFAFHLDMRAAELVRDGMTESEARQQAMREFGDVARGAQACATAGVAVERRRTLARLADEFRQDVRFALRLLVRSPGFSAAAILTLAVAIGGNTAIFGVVNALGFKPLPVSAPTAVVRVYSGESQMSWPNYEDIRQRNRVFSDVAAHARTILPLTDGDRSTRLMGETVSANFLTMLGIPAAHGRIFGPEESRGDVLVLSERTWRTRFASDPSIVGRTVTLNRRRYEVIGVMPPGFRGVNAPGLMSEFWIPVARFPSSKTFEDRYKDSFEVVARLQPEVPVEQALAEMRLLGQQLRTEHPQLPASFAAMEVFGVDGLGGFRGVASTMAPVFLFIGLMTIVAGLVLLVGCANISGLLLGRAAARRREIGLRLALGAGRGRLIRQLLTESLLLALAGAFGGLLFALWLGGFVNQAVAGLPVPFEFDLGLDRRMLAYTIVLASLTSVLCGLAPARRSTRLEVLPALKEGDPHATRQRLRLALLAGQVAVSCLLLLWGGLFTRSLSNVHRVDPGFTPAGILLAHIGFDGTGEPAGGIAPFVEALQARALALPGVESAGTSSVVPLALRGREEFSVRVDGDGADAPRRRIMANRVTPGWFETLRIPLIAGRDFTIADRQGSPRVVIVNETAARRFWTGDAVGRRVHDAEVIGVIRDSKYWTLGETVQPTLFFALTQEPLREITLHVRTKDFAAATAGIRRELQSLSPDLYAEMQPMAAAVSAALLPAQVGAAATGAFGSLGALLAMMGIYGLVAFTVAQRTREIGIRKAIGARTIDIVRLVVRGTVVPVSLGLAIGLSFGTLGALALGGFIVGVSPADPLTIAGTIVLVTATAVAASAIPALRATRVDAITVLKAE